MKIDIVFPLRIDATPMFATIERLGKNWFDQLDRTRGPHAPFSGSMDVQKVHNMAAAADRQAKARSARMQMMKPPDYRGGKKVNILA